MRFATAKPVFTALAKGDAGFTGAGLAATGVATGGATGAATGAAAGTVGAAAGAAIMGGTGR